MLWRRFGDGAPLGPRPFPDAVRALGDAEAGYDFEVGMMRDAQILVHNEIARATRRRRGRR